MTFAIIEASSIAASYWILDYSMYCHITAILHSWTPHIITDLKKNSQSKWFNLFCLSTICYTDTSLFMDQAWTSLLSDKSKSSHYECVIKRRPKHECDMKPSINPHHEFEIFWMVVVFYVLWLLGWLYGNLFALKALWRELPVYTKKRLCLKELLFFLPSFLVNSIRVWVFIQWALVLPPLLPIVQHLSLYSNNRTLFVSTILLSLP